MRCYFVLLLLATIHLGIGQTLNPSPSIRYSLIASIDSSLLAEMPYSPSAMVPQELFFQRVGQEVVCMENTSGTTTVKKYHVQTLQFTVINRSHKTEVVDSFSHSLDYRKAQDWNVDYQVKELEGKKKILGFDCQHFEVVETKTLPGNQAPEIRIFRLWATSQIAPALSVHAVLGLYSIVLPDHSPMQVEIISKLSKQTMTALEVK